ncbi:MAG: right-handed parallel beta-helix repeat-containing protein [Patescibacteria group bacterium]
MKKTTVILTLSAGLLLGGLLVSHPAHAATAPYLLPSMDSETIATPTTIINLKPVLIQPTGVPSNILRAPLQIAPDNKTPTRDCIDPDTYTDGYFYYNDPTNTPITLTLCNKTYTRTTAIYKIVGINSANVTLDCNGAIMVGNYDFSAPAPNPAYYKIAIYALVANNLTIKNCTIGGFGYGMYVGGGYDSWFHLPNPPMQVTLFNNTFTQSSYIDMVVSSAINSDIYNNTRAAGTDNRSVLPTIDLEFVSDSSIHDNTLLSNGGINLAFNSNNNQVYGNTLGQFTAGAATPYAIFLNHGSANNNVYNNAITGAAGQGIRFDGERDTDTFLNSGGAKFNDVHNNSITDTTSALYFTGGAHSNTAHDNTIANAADGVLMEGFYVHGNWAYSHDNTIHTNLIESCSSTGLYLTNGNTGNIIYNNSFVNNFIQAAEMAAGNFFDSNGQGNNWSDYDEEIEGCLDTNTDGVCDASYTTGGMSGAVDHYPLTDMTIWAENAPPTLAPLAEVNVNEGQKITIQLAGSDPDSQITYYTNAGEVIYDGFAFDPATGLFEWTPAYHQSGVYHINFGVTDGQYRDSDLVTVTVNDVYLVCGDSNWDSTINILDIVYLINYIYKSGPLPMPYKYIADVNGEGAVNILDIVFLINYIYKHGPQIVEQPGVCHSPTNVNTEFAN